MLKIRKSRKEHLKLMVLYTAIIAPWLIGAIIVTNKNRKAEFAPSAVVHFTQDTSLKADHSQFAILQQEFATPHELTAACLSCHNRTSQEVMQSSHWNWSRDYVLPGGDTIPLGKKNIINNFCIGIGSNEPRCTSCHTGYGWDDNNFNFAQELNIDCVVCHDQTGTYEKFPAGAGYPVDKVRTFEGKTYTPPDYSHIAQNVGKPSKKNCGVCHFTGGGGNNVKHGDMGVELTNMAYTKDVHMSAEGANMKCIDCHTTTSHNIPGNLYSIASVNEDRVTCEQCHTAKPHHDQLLNRHTHRVACQTCHIPTYAKKHSTKMYWDWSVAGQFDDKGKMIVTHDSTGNVIYHSKKGAFQWAKNVVPEYAWFNGRASHYLLGEAADTSSPVKLNTLLGDYHDKDAMIIPVKVHRGKQIYDPVNNTMIVPHLYGDDSTSYWKNFDWNRAAETGMKHIGLPYSGQYTFVSTEMYWPLNHMIAPAEEALTCDACHARKGNLENLAGFYLSGRDHNPLLDYAGLGMIIVSFLGVIVHATLRTINKRTRTNEDVSAGL